MGGFKATHRSRAIEALLIASTLACSTTPAEAPPESPAAVPIAECSVDVHQHFASNVPFGVGASAMLDVMDEVGIAVALVQPPPIAAPEAIPPGGVA